MKTERFNRILPISIAAAMWAGLSCAPAEQSPERAAVDAAPTARHALRSERLRAIMTRMGGESAKTWPQEIAEERERDAQVERGRRFEQARALASALSQAAGQIPQAINDVALADVERAAFLANAERLRSQAAELEALAGARDFERMHSTLHSIHNTCNGCHSQFRELTGPVELPPNAL